MKTLVPIIIIAIIAGTGILLNNLKTSPANPDTSSNSTSETNINNECIITINGDQYDVTQFQNLHPGGNIFRCGTDMTSDFENQHGNDLDRIKPYKIN